MKRLSGTIGVMGALLGALLLLGCSDDDGAGNGNGQDGALPADASLGVDGAAADAGVEPDGSAPPDCVFALDLLALHALSV